MKITAGMNMKRSYKLIISILIPLAIGYFGSIFTSSSINSWYPTINKPHFTPPNWIFAPVWTTLFVLMGLAFYFVWQEGYSQKTKPSFFVYFFQLSLNLLWSFFFFGLRSPPLGFIDIVLLWSVIMLNIYLFYKISKLSGYLLIPYLVWVTIALVLNFYIIILN
jgi:benzodiazapine receptor